MQSTLGLRVLAAGILGLAAFAQQPAGDLTLSGTVTNSKTGEPVAHALVRAIVFGPVAAQSGEGGAIQRPTVQQRVWSMLSDAAGSFSFHGLPPGRYNFFVSKPGFTSGPADAGEAAGLHPIAGRPEDDESVALTTSKNDLRLTLSPLGVITGKVSDQDGVPVRGVDVAIAQVSMADGFRQISARVADTTDDRGIYRIYDLSPGEYYLRANGMTGGAVLYFSNAMPADTTEEAFAPVYFGGSAALDSALPIHVEAGSEARADVSVTMDKAYRIRGVLTNRGSGPAPTFELRQGGEPAFSRRTNLSGVNGRFEMADVVPGSYTLHVTQAKSVADVPVTVSDSDLTGVRVTLAQGVAVPIRSNFSGGEDDGRACWARLHDSSGQQTLLGAPRPFYPGEPAIEGVLPGKYHVVLVCSGGYVHSAVFGSQDLLANPEIAILPGAQPPPIEIQASSGGGSVSGTLAGANDGAAVLLVPQFAGSTGPQVTEAFEADDGGGLTFEFEDLAPGSYMAYAFSKLDELEYRNPAFLQSLTGGVSVRAEDGHETAVKMQGVVR